MMANTYEPLLIARDERDISILPKMANRHGLIAGATGTGKTVSLRVLAERFSSIGVPVFMADLKGDLSGIAWPGGDNPKVVERIQKLGLTNHKFEGYPVIFWDVLSEQGHPIRATISEMGPLLLSRLLNLNEVQGGVLSLAFKIADDNGLLLLDLKDLQALVRFVGDNEDQFKTRYGNISKASVGAIQRNLLTIQEQGGDKFFGEPALNLDDLMQVNADGKGVVNILSAEKIIHLPKLYATLLLWMLSELFEQLPEVGDLPKPKLIFFFDEAHLLFEDTPKALEEKIEQVVRLIRSKGVGIYFVTHNPMDLPEAILGQLGNRVQHALRAFTPKDQKVVKAVAQTFRPNPKLDVLQALTELGVGEALVSFLDDQGTPTQVERSLICPPLSRLRPATPEERSQTIKGSVLYGYYEKSVDRESAYEKLQGRAEQLQEGASPRSRHLEYKEQGKKLFEAVAKSAAHAVGSQIGRQIVRGLLGSILGRKR
jgi:DNA double-strand break repair helicase HerA and related ATPase